MFGRAAVSCGAVPARSGSSPLPGDDGKSSCSSARSRFQSSSATTCASTGLWAVKPGDRASAQAVLTEPCSAFSASKASISSGVQTAVPSMSFAMRLRKA